jgi:membrane fusion protein (multidrug efflux system)
MTLFQPKPAMKNFRPFPAALAVVLGLLATSSAAAAEPVTVATVQPTRGDITRYVALPGTLRANQQVTVQARVAGFVKTIAVDRGDRVKAGQVLAEIEVPELIAERTKQLAEVKVAEVESRRLEAGRQKSPDLVTPQALDAATGRLEVARAELEKTETLLRYANLAAPFAGVVTARFVDAGAFVPASAVGGASAVVTLADTSVLRAQVPVPEADAVFVKSGQPVRLTVEGMTNVFAAAVSRHAGAVDEGTRSLLVEADLPNATDTLRPGMFATVRIGVERRAGALLVRTEAIMVEKTANFVFRVDNGVSRKIPVKLGFQDGAFTEVVSGITEEALIIIPAKSAPADGAAVRVGEAR